MSNPLSMFYEPNTHEWSMTRVVAWCFMITICRAMWVMANHDHLHDVGIPFAAIAIVTLLAVPVQAMFKAVVTWLKSKPGSDLIHKLVSKISDVDVKAIASGLGTTVETTTTVTPKGDLSGA
jgi:hypothetical protein